MASRRFSRPGQHSADLRSGHVAEVMVTRHNGDRIRGSGYLIRTGVLLTAAHVVAEAETIRVRFNADQEGQWTAKGSVAWTSDPDSDAALLALTPEPGYSLRHAETARFGSVPSWNRWLTCSTVGFPLFKKRENPETRAVFRDSCHTKGSVPLLSNLREGRLEFRVPAPEYDPIPTRSPWQGMSGAAVWSDGRIIGIIVEHHRSEGLGSLTVSRVDHWSLPTEGPAGDAVRSAGLLSLSRVRPDRRTWVVPACVMVAIAVATGSTVALADRIHPSPPPLRFQVRGTCTKANEVLLNHSSGFTPDRDYTTRILTPSGQTYTDIEAQGTVTGKGTLGWRWPCSPSDQKGIWYAQITDEATGRHTAWVPFTIGTVQGYPCDVQEQHGQLVTGADPTDAPVRSDSNPALIAEVQCLLTYHGYGKTLGDQGVDGRYGNGTKSAIEDFQRANGTDPDGIVGAITWALLRSPHARHG